MPVKSTDNSFPHSVFPVKYVTCISPSHLVDELGRDGGIHARLLVVEQLLDVILIDANLVVALHNLVVRQLHLSL